MEIGFLRDEVITCLRAALNDGNVAVEYLIHGIPEGLKKDVENLYEDYHIITGLDSEQAKVLQQFFNSDEFEHIRELLNNDPSSIRPFMNA